MAAAAWTVGSQVDPGDHYPEREHEQAKQRGRRPDQPPHCDLLAGQGLTGEHGGADTCHDDRGDRREGGHGEPGESRGDDGEREPRRRGATRPWGFDGTDQVGGENHRNARNSTARLANQGAAIRVAKPRNDSPEVLKASRLAASNVA